MLSGANVEESQCNVTMRRYPTYLSRHITVAMQCYFIYSLCNVSSYISRQGTMSGVTLLHLFTQIKLGNTKLTIEKR